MSRFQTLLNATSASVALAVALAATPALAQSTLPPADAAQAPAAAGDEGKATDIVVTGSRIRRDPLSQDAPIVFVDQADIAKTGLNSINDVLQRLPSAGGGLNGKFNNSGNFGNPPDGGGVGAGAAEIDLRYLGSRRTLVLVDGLRFVNAASASGVPGSVDLNAIPESMIERVEVLQDGASAIYGSDAIAGVVNIITKRSQQGFLASAQLGGYDDGDGFTQNYQLSWGNGGDGPTQIVVGGNFVKQDSISSGDRDISLFPAPGADSCLGGGCSSGTPLGRFIVLGQDLTLISPVIGRTPTLADFRPYLGAADAFNFAPFNFILTPLKRYGAFVNFRQELSDTINFSTKLVYNHRESKNQAAPLPLFVGPDAGNGNLLDTISIDASNPFNPFGVTLRGDNPLTPAIDPTYAFIGRRVVEGGPRRYNQKVNTYYGTATLDGSFDIGGRDWYWDVNGIAGKNKAEQVMFGNVNAALLQQALGPVGGCVGASNGCVPFNIFGGAGSITDAMLNFVGFIQNDSSEQKMWAATANMSGSLLDLPGGSLGLAVGLEHRDLRGRFDPDPVVQAGLGSDIPALATKGNYNVDEAYAELNAPLLADRPFFELLELNGAVRFSDYSESGSTTTFKAGVNWKPVADLRLRGTWSEGFRAPSIGELFGTPSRFDQEITDPCSAVGGAIPPAVAANCIAQGVPPGGVYVQNNPQIAVITGGNENLKPETSKGWNFGAVYSPSFLQRFSVEANYYNIKVKGAIQAINANTTLQACVFNNDPSACALVTRTASGQIANIQGLLNNIAAIETEGLDVNFSYRTGKMDWGTLGFTFNNTFLFNYDVIVPTATGTNKISREGTEQGSPDQAFPKHKAIGIIDWDGTNFGFSLTGRYIKGVKETEAVNKLGSRFYTDLQLRWFAPSFADHFGFAVGVNNLFDKDPPGCISCGLNNFDPGTYDVPGRYLYARATIKY
jgi:iron complex outermembrane receptor protein